MTVSPEDRYPGTPRPGAAGQSSGPTHATGGTPVSPAATTVGGAASTTTTERAKADAEEAGQQVKGAAEGLGASVGRKAEELKGRAGSAVEAAKERARAAAGEQKNSAAERVSGFAEALRHASSDLDHQGQSLVSGFVRQAADGLEDVSGAMRRNDLDDLVGGIEDFARRRPALFIGSAVLAGFGIARFIKASSERRRGRGRDYEPAPYEQGGPRYGGGPGTTYEGGV